MAINENGKINMDEVKDMLKKLSTILMLDGLKESSMEKITLANSLGVIMATLDLGPGYYESLLKALNVQGKIIEEQIQNGNPNLRGLSSVKPDDLLSSDGKINNRVILDAVLNGMRSSNDSKEDSGPTASSSDWIFEPKQ